MGLLDGVIDPVGYAGLLGDVAFVGSGGVVVLCHGARRNGEASHWVRFIGSPRIATASNPILARPFYCYSPIASPRLLPLRTPPPAYPRPSGSASSSPLSPHDSLPHTHGAITTRNGNQLSHTRHTRGAVSLQILLATPVLLLAQLALQ